MPAAAGLLCTEAVYQAEPTSRSNRSATVLCSARSGNTSAASTASSPARYCTAGRSVFRPVLTPKRQRWP